MLKIIGFKEKFGLVFCDILLNRRINFIVNPLTYIEIRYYYNGAAKSNHLFWHLKRSVCYIVTLVASCEDLPMKNIAYLQIDQYD